MIAPAELRRLSANSVLSGKSGFIANVAVSGKLLIRDNPSNNSQSLSTPLSMPSTQTLGNISAFQITNGLFIHLFGYTHEAKLFHRLRIFLARVASKLVPGNVLGVGLAAM